MKNLLTRLMSAQGPNAFLCRKAGELIKEQRRELKELRKKVEKNEPDIDDELSAAVEQFYDRPGWGNE